MKNKLTLIMLLATGILAISFILFSSCSDTSTNTPVYINNPNVTSFDSIGVEQDSIAFLNHTGIDLLKGVNTVDSAKSRDCSLANQNEEGTNFYLQSGVMKNNPLFAGYETMFFSVSPNMTAASFDTISKIYSTGHDTLRSIDFTDDSTASWGYFNYPLASNLPVYCFWLKGKAESFVTPKNVYGIIQPRESSDRLPFQNYGFRMSFRVRINTNGDNDFRKQILQQ